MSDYRISIGWPCIGSEEIAAVNEALQKKRLSQGEYVRAFEDAYAARLHQLYAVATNSGSSANLIALAAMKERYGWEQGDKVVVPALTFATAVAPVLQLGLKPVWCDVDTDGNMSFADGLLRSVTPRSLGEIKCLVLVHSLGVPAKDTQLICEYCEDNGVKILEDACESHGAKIKYSAGNPFASAREVGTYGTIATLSFFVAHNITTGEGGMAFTGDSDLAAMMRSYREFGRRPGAGKWQEQGLLGYYHGAYTFDRLGYNVRMTDIEAAIGVEQLKKLDGFNNHRRSIVTRIWEGLRDLGFYGFPSEVGRINTYLALKLTVPGGRRNALADFLESNGIETRPFVGGNLLRQVAFKCNSAPWNYPMAERLHNDALCVGCHPFLSDEDVDYLISKLREFATNA